MKTKEQTEAQQSETDKYFVAEELREMADDIFMSRQDENIKALVQLSYMVGKSNLIDETKENLFKAISSIGETLVYIATNGTLMYETICDVADSIYPNKAV